MSALRGGERQCSACGGTGFITTRQGAWVRQQRVVAGLTLRELARRLNLSAAYISDMELDRRQISESMWQRIATALSAR